MGADLLLVLPKIHPGHGKLAWLRVFYVLPLDISKYRYIEFALLTLGFPALNLQSELKQAKRIKSLAHSSIGTRSSRYLAISWTPALCKHMVSGLFHRPHRATFHLSLTVLVHYRSQKVFSLGSVGLPASHGAIFPRGTQENDQEC